MMDSADPIEKAARENHDLLGEVESLKKRLAIAERYMDHYYATYGAFAPEPGNWPEDSSPIPCSGCHGAGSVWGDPPIPCGVCGGSGVASGEAMQRGGDGATLNGL